MNQVPVEISCHSTHFRFCLHPCTDLWILWYSCRAGMQAVDQRGLKSLGCFQPREVMACQMSYQLSYLKLALVAIPTTLTNQSDAQVLVELCGLRATSRHCNSSHGTAPRCGWTSSARLRIGVLLSYSDHGVFKGSCVFRSTVLKARITTVCSGFPGSQRQGEFYSVRMFPNIGQAAPGFANSWSV